MCSVTSVVSDSLWPYGLLPARLLCLWDSPGKNTGGGCHALLQGIFSTQRQNPHLLHSRRILYSLSVLGSPERNLPVGKKWLEILTPSYLTRKANKHTNILCMLMSGFHQILLSLFLEGLLVFIQNWRWGPSMSLTLFCSFYYWIIHCICVPHLLYPFLYQWTFRLLLCPGYCK